MAIRRVRGRFSAAVRVVIPPNPFFTRGHTHKVFLVNRDGDGNMAYRHRGVRDRQGDFFLFPENPDAVIEGFELVE